MTGMYRTGFENGWLNKRAFLFFTIKYYECFQTVTHYISCHCSFLQNWLWFTVRFLTFTEHNNQGKLLHILQKLFKNNKKTQNVFLGVLLLHWKLVIEIR